MPADDLCESWFKSLSAESAKWPVQAPIRSNFLKLRRGTAAPQYNFFKSTRPVVQPPTLTFVNTTD